MQSSLFDNSDNLLPCQGEVNLYPRFFSQEESDAYLRYLTDEVHWKQEPIKMFGKEIMQPRLTAWYGDADKPYSYSGITMQALPWTRELMEIKQRAEFIAGVCFTGALLNFYRDGKDSMGWHRDNERALGPNPVIGSVSFGATRSFQFRNHANKKLQKNIDLDHGSFLLMKGETQHCWEHRLPKTCRPGPRINITFRVIL